MSDNVRVIDVNVGIFEENDRIAAEVRAQNKANGTCMVNVMASPGAGKTTTLLRTIRELGNEYRIGVMEADIDSDVDARTIASTGVKAIQLHTGGMCHLDADMTRQGIKELGVEDVDFAVLEKKRCACRAAHAPLVLHRNAFVVHQRVSVAIFERKALKRSDP